MTTATGTFTGPPAGAPVETAQPVDNQAVASRIAAAQAQRVAAGQPAEAELAPFNPPAVPVPPVPATPNAAEQLLATVAVVSPTRSHQPAASETDSPSRGIPRAIADPGKVITGGFGSGGEAQYYAITGLELQELVRGLLDGLNTRITNDLRFSIALTYPRLTVRLKLEVEGWAEDAGFVITHVAAPPRQTPLEIAADRADEVCFVVREQIREFDETGAAENPPDRMREIHGLPVPRKQTVQAGAIRTMVDIVPELPDDTF